MIPTSDKSQVDYSADQIDIYETYMYKINSTYTYGVISQNVQFLHQLTDHNFLRNITHHTCDDTVLG